MSRITQQELESYLWGAAVLLRGLIDAGDYKQFIFPLLFYKRASDVWDEEYQSVLADSDGDLSFAQFAENHRFQIPEGAHWNDVRQTSKNVGAAIQKAMRAIESANPDMLDGIFGDAPWTNRERLPDETLKNLIEHFSTQTLSVANVPEDELGNAYEYLIKKFADDSGHTAAEFYTNRTVVHLMTQLLAPQAGESIYDPTCGTGGMLISALDEVKRSGGEYRTLKLYGQERNLITSSIARMNLFLHGVEDFEIIRGDTLAEPKHIEGDRLRQFDVILANPPYSIKQWSREAWSSDKWGRNSLGTPPQGRADYAFQQHILTSLTAKGRSAVLWPHGVLFRNEEQAMRTKMVEQDWVEAVIGLGPNLFYNSPMESCILICNRKKVAARKGKVIFIDAVHAKGRKIFAQLMHTGRIGHPNNLPGGARLMAPSAIAAAGEIYTDSAGPQPHPEPHEMSLDDIADTREEFVHAAKNAMAAGFDGIELHAANGYLIEQFVRPASNRRTDAYGGPIENRARFVLEVAKATAAAIGASRVGIRLSPYGVFNDMPLYPEMDADYTYLGEQLGKLGLAYLHIVDHSAMGAPEVPEHIKDAMRAAFRGPIILSGGYDPRRAQADLDAGKADMIAVGRAFLANPDLPRRWRENLPLNEPDMGTFYTPGEKGYTDYPAYSA